VRGGKYLAEDRGAFDAPVVAAEVEATVEPEIEAATAPLFEVAAVHDGQPPIAWVRYFMQVWGGTTEDGCR
jgi:hypothetical protein